MKIDLKDPYFGVSVADIIIVGDFKTFNSLSLHFRLLLELEHICQNKSKFDL